MTDRPRYARWTFAEAEALARQCQSVAEFRTRFNGAYQAAKRRGWSERICAHMPPARSGRELFWTPERVAKIARNYTTRTNFSKAAPGAYYAARRMGKLNQVCAHMRPPWSRKASEMRG